ncbi:MAG: ATP synthase subunit I [Acidovorax sp.]|jgi:ATP synthase protein I|nr:ATP synthase subunit I [Acidovorax sp.]MDR3004020.1 ATP synthase subunit I [Acidovorax sp.]
MNKKAPWQDELEAEEEDFKPLTPEEAQAWRRRNPPVSVWRIVAGQVAVGALVALLAWGISGQARVGWSAAYGALCVVVPAVIFARGVTRGGLAAGAGAAMSRLFGWELVKLVLCIAMMAAAPRLVRDLSWLALLAGMVAVMKTYWIALLVRSGVRKTV